MRNLTRLAAYSSLTALLWMSPFPPVKAAPPTSPPGNSGNSNGNGTPNLGVGRGGGVNGVDHHIPHHGGIHEDANTVAKPLKKATQNDRILHNKDHLHDAPVDFGFGPGVQPPDGPIAWPTIDAATPDAATQALATSATPMASANVIAAAIPTGTAAAKINGLFGPVIPWPIIPIHLALLSDGRVMSYGTDRTGAQTGLLNYDLWTPSKGTGTGSHLLLTNHTNTDIFCSGLGLMTNGTLFVTGGDNTINGVRNYATTDANLFDHTTNTLYLIGHMLYGRWYPTVVPLPDASSLVVGGIGFGPGDTTDTLNPITTPELYDPANGQFWFPDADNGGQVDWFYPRIFVSSDSVLYDLDPSGSISTYSTSGTGAFQVLGTVLDPSTAMNPSVMFAPGEVLSVRGADTITITTQTHLVNIVSLSGSIPQMTESNPVPGGGREWANATLLADGQVFVNGGSGEDNQEIRVSYDSYIWNPATGNWTKGGTAKKERLYHSNALLLPDATVLTGGGGAPGPVAQLNAEIYYPPYLYTSTGGPAPRPVITGAPATAMGDTTMALKMSTTAKVSRVTFVRVGAVTHSFNPQQRFFDLQFTQTGADISAQLPSNGNDLLPGYYMVFVFNAAGTPSTARFVQLNLWP